jgi:hypothetical protein
MKNGRGQAGALARKKIGALCFFCAVLASCASTPAVPPEWVTLGVEAVYPQEAYIAVEGHGKSRKDAEEDALAALSRYFLVEVVANASAFTRAIHIDVIENGRTKTTDTDIEVITTQRYVQSAEKLFAVKCAKPYYNESEKLYTAVAYINREEAWRIFEPRVRREADGFRALWITAESETATLKSYFDYRAAYNFTRRDEFIHTRSFGEVLYPSKMNSLTRDVSESDARLPAKLNMARSMVNIFISINKDFESNITGTLTKLLSGEGLIITGNKKQAAAICAATVDEGFQRSDAGYFYYPTISVIITDTRGIALFSYSASPEKQAAMNADAAKRRAYQAVADTLKNNFVGEMNREFGVR